LEEQIFIQRGEIAVRKDETPPQISKRIRTSLFWLGKIPMESEKLYWLKAGTAKIRVKIEKIERIIDSSDYSTLSNTGKVGHHEVAICILNLQKPLAFESAESLPALNHFVIVDDYQISGGGIILNSLPEIELLPFQKSGFSISDEEEITAEYRSQRQKQLPALVLISGPLGSGRIALAKKLEKRLFQEGKQVYYLSVGSILDSTSDNSASQQADQSKKTLLNKVSNLAGILHLHLIGPIFPKKNLFTPHFQAGLYLLGRRFNFDPYCSGS